MNTVAAKGSAATRCCTRPWLETSIATKSAPCRCRAARFACTCRALPVVFSASTSSPNRPLPTVPITPALPPSRVRQFATSNAVVLLPLVPVMPTSCSWRAGWP
ncbi:hypothetical protein D3C80_1372660 [compost metagenome]